MHSDSQTVTGFRRGLVVPVAAKDVMVLASPREAIPALTGKALSTRALAGAPLSAAFSEASSSAACSEVQLQHSARSEAVYRPKAPTKQANAKSNASLYDEVALRMAPAIHGPTRMPAPRGEQMMGTARREARGERFISLGSETRIEFIAPTRLPTPNAKPERKGRDEANSKEDAHTRSRAACTASNAAQVRCRPNQSAA